MPTNTAAWIEFAGAQASKVKEAAFPVAGKGEVVIKNAAVAINPVDHKIQDNSPGEGKMLHTYPFILGEDCSGTIEQVGDGITSLKKGDSVIALSPNLATQDAKNSTFQKYTLMPLAYVIPVPKTVAFKDATVLPLALATAAAALFPNTHMGLALPPVRAPAMASPGAKKTILIWGGSSSVGLTATQLAVASGVRVVTTASLQNHNLVRSAGAAAVYDHRLPSVVQDLASTLGDGDAGDFLGVFDAISTEVTFGAVEKVLQTMEVRGVRVATVLPHEKESEFMEPRFATAYSIFAPPNRHIVEYLFKQYAPQALADGRLKTLPEALVVGTGLESVQKGIDLLREGVSGRKVVVEL